MSQKLSCHHGHRFKAPKHADSRVICPLCGAVAKLQRKLATRRDGSVDQTLNLPSSESPETSPDKALDKTLDLDVQLDAGNEILRTASFDEAPDSDAPSPDTDCDHADTRTVALGKTVSLAGPGSLSGNATREATGDDPLSPTAILQTVDSQLPPAGRESGTAKSSTKSAASSDELLLKPPNLPGYKVLDVLGRGGMGVVYRAWDEKRKREVALKTLLRISPEELKRFKQEFRALADIAHPNLAVLYDLLSDGETWCFSMEILKGVDFTEYVWSGFEAFERERGNVPTGTSPSSEPRLTPAIKQRLYNGLEQLTLGLNALHKANLLHRDIKPSNVLVTTEGRVVLVDFGLVAQFEEGSKERPTGIQGTPEYMSPEQAACKHLKPPTDWYAVGVMIYEILTGYFPIDGKPIPLIFKKQTDTPKPPCEVEPFVPDELNDLCVALLAIDQDERPQPADVLRCIGADALIETLDDTERVGSGQTLELVGREGHLRGLRASFKQAQKGKTKTIFVHGRSGMGKSVLIQKFLGELREAGSAVVLSGRCYEQESVPFKALDNLIDSLADHLVGLPEAEVRAATPHDLLPLIRLFPVLGQIPGASDVGRPMIENVDQQELRQRAMNALRELLERLGQHKPLVLYIDDLQWGDEDSADLLADLVRPPDAPRILVLGSYRTENKDTSSCLQAIDKAFSTGQHRPHREEIAVDSLQFEDATRLALMLLRRGDAEGRALADKIARESQGWPFFVWELAQFVQDTSDFTDQSLVLDEVIWTRVTRLPEETRTLLELVAVTGRPIPAIEAYQAIGAVEKGQGFLAQLRTRHFVRSTDSAEEDTLVETYHDRIRESVLAHLTNDAIAGYSLQLANTFEQVSGIQAAALWTHINGTALFEEAGEPFALDKHQWQRVFDLGYFFDAAGQHERAFPFALCAAEQARKQDALEVAEQQFRIALRGTANVSTAIRFRVHEGLGDVLVLRGRYEEAIEQFQAARDTAKNQLVLARIDGKLGNAAFKKGDMGHAGEYQEKALSALGERPPGNTLTLAFGLVKEIVTQTLHTCLPSRFVGRRRVDTPRARQDLFRVRLYDDLTLTYWFTKRMEMVLWSHLRGLNLGELYPPSQELGRTYAFHAITMTGIPMAQRGITYAEKAYQISIDNGDLWGQGKARSFHTFSCIVLARFKEGVRTGTEAVRLLEQAGDIWEANMARMISTVPMYHLGDLKSAYVEAKKAYEIGLETHDYSAACISLLFWVPAAPHLIPPGAIQAELARERNDPLAITGAVYARGLELLLCEDNPLEAAEVLGDCLARAKQRGLRNVCVFSAATWKATALRIAAERALDSSTKRQRLKHARKAIRAALSITKLYRACRPHALREAGIVAAMEGRVSDARRYFDASLEVAAAHEAPYDDARTRLARGEAGLRFGWTDAERELDEAKVLIAEFENVEQSESR